MTSVTISDELRRKLKRFAAKYDTTLADIIEKALEIFEKYEVQQNLNILRKELVENNNSTQFIDNAQYAKIKKTLTEVMEEFERSFPKIAQQRRDLRQNLALLDEVIIEKWALPFEE